MVQSAVLYGTIGCHLCDNAVVIISPALLRFNVQLAQVDIAGNEALENLYGIRIPVLVFNGKELSWPFSTEEVERLLAT